MYMSVLAHVLDVVVSKYNLTCNDITCGYPCAPDAQHQEGAIQMTENPAYAAIPDYCNVTNAF